MTLKEIFTFEKLYEAHKHCRLSKQHKREVIDFEVNLSNNLIKMSNQLQNKTYIIGNYRKFKIYEPKERIIEALPYKDRVVIMCFCKYSIMPRIEKLLIDDNVSCRKEKGSLFGIKRLEKFLKREYLTKKNNNIYFLKCDIKKYFPSISHEILINNLKKVGFSKDEMWFIEKLIRYKNSESYGLPLGNLSSQWFALFYLNKVDRFIKEQLKIKGYVRYMDDMILIHRDKKYLQECKKEIEKICNNDLNLSLNDKTQIGKVSNGIDFLGFRHILTAKGKVIRKLRSSSKIRLKHHLKTLYKLKDKNLVDSQYVIVRRNSFYAHILYSNESKLKEELKIK